MTTTTTFSRPPRDAALAISGSPHIVAALFLMGLRPLYVWGGSDGQTFFAFAPEVRETIQRYLACRGEVRQLTQRAWAEYACPPCPECVTAA